MRQEFDEPATGGAVSLDMIITIGKRYVLSVDFRGVAVRAGDSQAPGGHITPNGIGFFHLG